MRSRSTSLQAQPPLPDFESYRQPKFPSTRYQGSKLKLIEWIWENVSELSFDTVLDAFGGTGCVSHFLKLRGKQVTYSDILNFNHIIGQAIVENSHIRLSRAEVELLLSEHPEVEYPTFIQENFQGIYYTDEENRWLDRVVTNIGLLDNNYRRAIAYFALFQACIVKRPFNLFHRKNLYIRTSNVKRNFGNKTSWDKSFEDWFWIFVEEVNGAVFSNGKHNEALKSDALSIAGKYDLVYIDTPYIASSGIGVDYHHFYHFLEGLSHYPSWSNQIDRKKKHLPLNAQPSPWTNKNKIYGAFDALFDHFKESILVVSYRDNGIPSDRELLDLLAKHKKDVFEVKRKNYKYVLSTSDSAELLFIAK